MLMAKGLPKILRGSIIGVEGPPAGFQRSVGIDKGGWLARIYQIL